MGISPDLFLWIQAVCPRDVEFQPFSFLSASLCMVRPISKT